MPLVRSTELLQKARREHYALGAFNINNMETLQGIAAAAAANNSPVIIQVSQGAIAYAGIDYLLALVKTASDQHPHLPMVLHLDHGTDFNIINDCLEKGFTSVMFDGSALPLAENIKTTRKVVNLAHQKNASVEAEIGRVGGVEEHINVSHEEAVYTNPEEAASFVEQTNCDSLAVAIGTAHGQYQGEVKLNFSVLAKIQNLVSIPIVLHGSSGVPTNLLQEAIALGVSKINIDTDLRLAFVQTIYQTLQEKPTEIDPRKILGPAREAVQKVVTEKINIFGSANQI